MSALISGTDCCCCSCCCCCRCHICASRSHSEILDTMCFPTGLKLPIETSTSAAGGAAEASNTLAIKPSKPSSGGSSEPPFSALDGLWQLLKQAPSLLSSQPRLLAAVLRVLATLWECQGAAHGAVELLRGQEDFWTAFKVGCWCSQRFWQGVGCYRPLFAGFRLLWKWLL
jgi:hypothetical protein